MTEPNPKLSTVLVRSTEISETKKQTNKTLLKILIKIYMAKGILCYIIYVVVFFVRIRETDFCHFMVVPVIYFITIAEEKYSR